MNCQEFWKRLEMPPGAETGLSPEHEAHLAACRACGAHMARQRELAAGLRRVAESFSGMRAPARLESRLLHAFREQNGLPAPARQRRWLVPLCWSAAAALLLAAALFLTAGKQPAPARSTPPTAEMASLQEVDATVQDDGFIPLPNAEQIGPNDTVNLVRMEVPRATMVELGFAGGADRGSDRVVADVLLGADGLARAVRFLE